MGPTGATDAVTTMGPTGATDAVTTMAPSDATTATVAPTAAPTVTKVLFDLKHHKAIIVRTDGCYEYHMNHQEILQADDANLRKLLEDKMIKALEAATETHETGHHHIDHMTQE